MNPTTIFENDISVTRIHCSKCNKNVSTPFIPLTTKNNTSGLFLMRAWVTCPDCIEKDDDKPEKEEMTEPVKVQKPKKKKPKPVYLTPKQFVKRHRFMTMNKLRWILFKGEETYPGLEACLVRKSNLIYIDEKKFFKWFDKGNRVIKK